MRLAHVLARGGDVTAAQAAARADLGVGEGRGPRRHAARGHRGASSTSSRRIRPMAWLLSATLAVDPSHPLVGPLVETLMQQGRGERWIWNTQDYGTAVSALAEFQRAPAGRRRRRVCACGAGGRSCFELASLGAAASAIRARRLGELVRGGARAAQRLRLDAPSRRRSALLLRDRHDRPRASRRCGPATRGSRSSAGTRATRPGKPVTEIAEGALVRVRLRVTVPQRPALRGPRRSRCRPDSRRWT